MSKDGMLDPVEGLNSPVGMGTLSVTLALTRAVQVLAGKDSKLVDKFLQDALQSKLFENASEEVKKSFRAPIERALKETQAVRDLLAKKDHS